MIPETWRLISVVILIFLLLIDCIPLTSFATHACFVPFSMPIKDDKGETPPRERKFLDFRCAIAFVQIAF